MLRYVDQVQLSINPNPLYGGTRTTVNKLTELGCVASDFFF